MRRLSVIVFLLGTFFLFMSVSARSNFAGTAAGERGAELCANAIGDVNASGATDFSDAINILAHLFLGDPESLAESCAADKISVLEAQLAEQEAALADQDAKIAEQEETIAARDMALAKREADITTLVAERDTLQESLSTTQTELDTANSQLATANADLDNCNTNDSTCSSDLETANSQLTAAEGDLQSTQDGLYTCQDDLQTAQDDLASCLYAPLPLCGCTDPEASNYNPEATVDDGNCVENIPDGFSFVEKNEQGYDEYTHDGSGIRFVHLPGGEFEMGSPEDEQGRYSNEGPVHTVKLNPFLIAKYEVTQAEYELVMTGNTAGRARPLPIVRGRTDPWSKSPGMTSNV